MFPEQYQGWSLLSPFPAERFDYKTTGLLVLSLSGPWPIFYFCHWNSFHQDRVKNIPISSSQYLIFSTTAWRMSEAYQSLHPLLNFWNSIFLLVILKVFPVLSPSFPTSYTHTQGEAVLLFTQHWKELSLKSILFFLLVSVTVFHFFKLLDEHILVFFMISKTNTSFWKYTSNKYYSGSWWGPGTWIICEFQVVSNIEFISTCKCRPTVHCELQRKQGAGQLGFTLPLNVSQRLFLAAI